MHPVEAAAAIGLATITLYAIFGGADFGGGVWDLLAGGPRREQQRTVITNAIGPIWEANHVWLIFAVVVLFTCFPPAYADIATQLNAPLTLALVGIVLRGSAFIFRNYVDVEELKATWTVVFGSASIIAPFFLGTTVGAIATARYEWTSPFSLSIGLFAVALTAQVAAVFLLRETHDEAVRADFRKRAIAATLAVWIIGLVPVALGLMSEPAFIASLASSQTADVAIGTALVLGLGVMIAVVRGADLVARVLVGAEIVAVLLGWFGAQAPSLIPGHFTYATAAAPDATLIAFLIAAGAGSVVLVPSLLFLYFTFKVRTAQP